MKRSLVVVVLVFFAQFGWAQELQANVSVNYQQVNNGNPQLFANLEKQVNEFLNTTKWTDKQFNDIEKIDISEERVRLSNHCAYFRSVLAEADLSKGKKLSFILQEFGREINTTGSKANDVGIQQVVIRMKDELEKIKEQSLNVL